MSFLFNDTATTEIYTLSRHDALPIYPEGFVAWNLDLLHSLRRDVLGIQREEEHVLGDEVVVAVPVALVPDALQQIP